MIVTATINKTQNDETRSGTRSETPAWSSLPWKIDTRYLVEATLIGRVCEQADQRKIFEMIWSETKGIHTRVKAVVKWSGLGNQV